MPLKDNIRFKDPAFIDTLTGIYNRYFLYQAVPEIIQKAETSHSILGILMLDIDNFKNINDTYGHLKGDSALKEVARVLEGCVRGEDLVIRYAGDEFIVLLTSPTHESASFEAVGRRIIEKVSKIVFKVEETAISLTVSGGLAIYPLDGRALDDLIDCADKALYLSKEKGRNQLSLSEEVTQEITTQKEALGLFPCAKFINRLAQMESLKKALQESFAGKISFVLVKAKTGFGKSRLMDEFKKIAEAQQIFSLKISTSPKHTPMPYYVLCQALEGLLRKNQALVTALASSLSEEEINNLATVIPVFKDSVTATKAETLQEDKGLSLFKTLRNICVDFSYSQGLLLYFDGIQWLDRATFELLDYLFNYEFARTIMVCAALDEEELKEDSFCREFLSRPKDKINFSLWELPPFSAQETRELITGIFPDISLPEEFSQYICEITEGSPLFIEELLKYLLESRIILYKENKWQFLKLNKEDIPSSLEDVLERRFRKLDPETKEMLAKAVVIGDNFEAEVLRRAIKKDQGYLFELLDRAKKKSFIGAKDKMDKFGFIPSSLQKLIYEQIESHQKANLHQEVALAIEEMHKDKPQEILGDLTYHYAKTGDTLKFTEYKNKLLIESLKFFNPQEVSGYLETLSKEATEAAIPFEVRIKRIDREITEEGLGRIADLIKCILAAIRNIALYPPGNKMRENSIEKVYEILKGILKDSPSLSLAEIEKLLLINNKRIPFEKEKESVINDFITFMIDRDIKIIQFLPLINKEEIDLFLGIMAQNPEALRGGLVAQLLQKKKIKYIKIDTAFYLQIARQQRLRPITEQLNKITLMDFLSGKAKPGQEALENFLKVTQQEPKDLARDLTEVAKSSLTQRHEDTHPKEVARLISESIQRIAEELLAQGRPDAQEALHKLISSLDESIKPYFFSEDNPFLKDMVKRLSDEEIMEIIINAARLPEKDRLLYMRELFNRLVAPSERKQELTSKLRGRLEKIGLSKSEISFVTQKKYETLSFQERMATILQLPPLAYASLGEENIQDCLKELIENSDKDNLKILLRHFLSVLESGDAKIKKTILKLLVFLFSSVPCQVSEFDDLLTEVISRFLQEFAKADLAVYPAFLGILESAIEWNYKGVFTPLALERWIMRSRFSQLDAVLNFLYEIMESKEESAEIQEKKKIVEGFILNSLLNSQLIEALALELKDPFLDYNQMITKNIVRFGRNCLKKFLEKVSEGRDFSWDGSLYRKKIATLLKNMGNEAKEEIRGYLASEKNPQRLKQIIEIAGFLGEEDLVESLKPFAKDKDYEIKAAAVLALNNIGSPLAKRILINKG